MIKITVNNGRTLEISQDEDREIVLIATEDRKEGIPEGDFVMLLNYYRYVIDNDIRCDFINPNGKEAMPHG